MTGTIVQRLIGCITNGIVELKSIEIGSSWYWLVVSFRSGIIETQELVSAACECPYRGNFCKN